MRMDRIEAWQVASPVGMFLPSIFVMLVSQTVRYTIGAKNTLGAQLYLADITAGGEGEGEKPTMKSAYIKTKGRVAGLAGNQLLLSLIAGVVLGSCTVFLNYLVMYTELEQSPAIDIGMTVLSLASGFVGPWSLLLEPAAALGEKSGFKLGLVSRMLKGNFWRVLVAAFAGEAISTLYGEFTRFVNVNPYVNTGIKTVIFLLTFGFYSAAAFAAYQQLNQKPEPAEDVGNDVHIVPLIKENIIPLANEESTAEENGPDNWIFSWKD